MHPSYARDRPTSRPALYEFTLVNAQECISKMKTSTIITTGLAALAATPTLTNGVASCLDGQYVPVSPQPQHINGTQS